MKQETLTPSRAKPNPSGKSAAGMAANEIGFSTFAVLERAKRAEELGRGLSDLSRVPQAEGQSECAEGQARVAIAISKRREKPQLAEVRI